MKADWVSVHEALGAMVGSVVGLEAESCELGEASGRVLAADVIAPIDLPIWTNSAMDGFAVHSADVIGASVESPIALPVVDDVAAGAFPRGPLARKTAVRVMTGAPVPAGADTVIRVEHTLPSSDAARAGAEVRIVNDHDAGRNLRQRGEEVKAGSVALTKGTWLTPAAIGVAASLGQRSLPVVRKPLVALLTSGDELVELEDFDEVAAGRKIVSSNTYSLQAMIRDSGCEVRYLGIARDSAESLRAALAGAEGCDALVTSAGVSVGEHDYVKRVLLELRTDVRFWRVRMRPGSPFAFGSVNALGDIPWFGLPGNPVSSAVTFEIFVRPALMRMSGREEVFRRCLRARLLDDYPTAPGLTHFARVVLAQEPDGAFTARLTGPQGSGILRSVARADGLMVIAEDLPGARAGDLLPVILLDQGRFSMNFEF